VASNSDTLIAKIGLDTGLHPDFGSYRGYGIPYNTVPGSQRKLTVRSTTARSQTTSATRSPAGRGSRAGSDHHMLIVDSGSCKLYEMWNVRHTRRAGGPDRGGLEDDVERAAGRTAGTSADAAGLPICPGWCATRRWPRA
jgi:hypothetical protein